MPTWKEITTRNPDHSQNYADRWDRIAAEGNDIYGEARLVDAIAPRHARILDAGCGQGRIGGYLAERGHDVVGVDLDPLLIDIARHRYPEASWKVADLAERIDVEPGFQVGVCAGNVLTFLAPAERPLALKHLYEVMAPGSRLLVGFGAGRGYPFPAFLEHAEAAGFEVSQQFSSWDLEPMKPNAGFLVAELRK
ncbi:class I SAM-dependent methyltransferase [Corynebacterium gerontici]|uniref:Magnesium-protoporphyrin O-methyltransferase n=1 Tax=Corynebacterium gerontici TaxID=2079234 RepID=A0A3G6J0S4_9CORY|nr:class I SAM-dependent methyltransferase [Corynebacterium gerontici]AZA11393.1 Magnesium-protoporphyrin O-methyltransferase [Corynebacterium gerontici]